jgi:hypothetical protein
MKDEILSTNSSDSLKERLKVFQLAEQGILLKEEEPEEKPQQKQVAEMPKLTVHDFSPKKMYDMFGNIDFDGENLYIIGPDGEVSIDEEPDPNLVKIAMINRIWKVTCLNMLPDPSDEDIAEVNKTLFTGDNAIILDRISKMLMQDHITSVDTILRSLAGVDGVQNESAFIHKAFDFLSNLAQFGDMELDFKGVLPRKAYIEMIQDNGRSGPEFHNSNRPQ